MIFGIVMLVLGILAEMVFWIFRFRNAGKRTKAAKKSLHKLMEEHVLTRTLKERINTQQASSEELQKKFLYMEFLNTKPLIMHVFGLDECITIGRSQDNMIWIRDPMLSRMHCKISQVEGNLVLQDMGTANGTVIQRGILGRVRLNSGEQVLLYPKDVVKLGKYRLKIRVLYGYEAEM